MSDLTLLNAHPNLGVGVIATITVYVAEAVVEPGWESLTLKGLLLVAVLYLVRELTKQRELDKQEAVIREGKLISTVSENTAVMQELKNEVAQQTKYFQDVAKVIIEGKVGSH